MKIYLDNCCFNRLFDDQSHLRIKLESEAERFIALVLKEPFDYTKWRQGLHEDLLIEELSNKAMDTENKNCKPK